LRVSTLTPDQQAMLAAWQQHTYAEFVLKDADAALATMTENPYVLLISSGTGGTGWPAIGSDSYQDVVVRLN
jgi:hypothetical protein